MAYCSPFCGRSEALPKASSVSRIKCFLFQIPEILPFSRDLTCLKFVFFFLSGIICFFTPCVIVLATSEIDFSCNVNATIKLTESSAQKYRDLLFFTRLQLQEQASKNCEAQLYNALTYLVLRITPLVKIYMKVARHDVTVSHRPYYCDFNAGNIVI